MAASMPTAAITGQQEEPMRSANDVSLPTQVILVTSDHEVVDDASSLRLATQSPLSSSAAPDMVSIALTATEHKLFDTLRKVAQAWEAGELVLPLDDESTYALRPTPSSPLTIRIAGGWVRDKLLERQTKDVDVAIDIMTGVQFGKLVQTYLQERMQSIDCSKMGIIKANPAQSKHLETATMKLYGLDVDFTHLRSQEIYQDHSRIPTVSLGTPYDDAMRRDFTMNALFFNLQTGQVEDWTKQGYASLQSKVLTTPLAPLLTFADDPLRMLRAVRFAVRCHMQVPAEILQACRDQNVQAAFDRKVSRERIGQELEGMLSGAYAQPTLALALLSDLHLAPLVFRLPPTPICVKALSETTGSFDKATMLQRCWQDAAQLNRLLPTMLQSVQALTENSVTVDQRLLPLATFLLPFRHWTYHDVKQKEWPVLQYIMHESLKFKNKDAAIMLILHAQVNAMGSLLSISFERSLTRLQVGMLLRGTKDLWYTTLLLATVLKLHDAEGSKRPRSDQNNSQKLDWLEAMHCVYRFVIEQSLDGCWKVKPLLSGKDICLALHLPSGPIVARYVDEQARWMLAHPDGSADHCLLHLQAYKEG